MVEKKIDNAYILDDTIQRLLKFEADQSIYLRLLVRQLSL